MRLSSIFNFDTYRVRWRLPGWTGILVLLLAGAELTLRVPAVDALLPRPEPTLWHAPNVQAKLDYLRHLQATRSVDVLFMGNSTVLAGLDPQVFDGQREKYIDRGPASFNGALEGLPAEGVLTYVKIYSSNIAPAVVIYGITPQDLNENSALAHDVGDKISQAPFVIAETSTGPIGPIMAGLIDHSKLFRYRFVLAQLLVQGGNVPAPTIYFDSRGYVAGHGRLSDVAPENRIASGPNGSFFNYSVEGKQSGALQELLAYCAGQHSLVILLNMPVSDEYERAYYAPELYQRYLTTVTRLAAMYHVPFWDFQALPANERFDDTEFADANHLNQNGATRLSSLVANRYAALRATLGNRGMQSMQQESVKSSPPKIR